MADAPYEVVHEIPYEVSSITSFTSGQYVLQDNQYDYAIAGIPFLSGISDQRPYTERMAEIRKEQRDNFAEPGEQSLQGWWLRSQSTFTGGAGILYQDPDTDNQFNFRFSDSLGIDSWTPGNLQLLRDVQNVNVVATTPNLVQGFVDTTGVDAYWEVAGNVLRKVTDAANVLVVPAGSPTYFDITSTGTTYLLARSDGIYKGTDAALGSNIYSATLTGAVLEFAKARLILGTNGSIYQLVLSPATPPAPLPTPTYTHQDPNWRWRSISDGPNFIYAAGDSGTTSEIHKFTATVDSTSVPQLAWAGVTATMPAGERIRTIYSYVASFIGIATSRGFRVGLIDSNGDISYGPLLFEPTGGCQAITGFDRFMWVGSNTAHDGSSGLFRVDLGSQVQEQTTQAVRYAYSRDIYANTEVGMVTSVTMFGASDRKVFAIAAQGSFREYASTLVPTGYLNTGRIRFNTEEPKLYKFFSIRTPTPLQGNLNIAILTEGGGVIPSITYGPGASPGASDVGISQPIGPQNWLALQFTLSRGMVDSTIGAIMNGWQIKALPGSIRQRVITHPFLLFDEEADKGGQTIGYEGYARDRFEDFKAVARAGDVILLQDLKEQLVTQVLIEDWEFRQTGPPTNQDTLGGYLTVVMRTVAEST